jgi:hypothetical protein
MNGVSFFLFLFLWKGKKRAKMERSRRESPRETEMCSADGSTGGILILFEMLV